jgi:hypothetical protein
MELWTSFGEAAKTAAGFFWKSGWTFVLGYFISAMIEGDRKWQNRILKTMQKRTHPMALHNMRRP